MSYSLTLKVDALFGYKHLKGQLREISQPFYKLAVNTLLKIPDGKMKESFLEKLWEAKNAAVMSELLRD